MKRKEKHYRNILPGLILLIALFSCRQPAGQEDKAVHVREFGVLANSGEDAAEGILRAIHYAQSNGIRKVLFDAGTYTFKNIPGRDPGDRTADLFYIQLTDVHDLELVGAADDKGEPATLWLKHNDLKTSQPGFLAIQRGSGVTVRNIAVDMDPYYYSAGKVVKKEGDEVTLEILEGHPIVDGQPAYIMGTYDLEAGKSLVVRITWSSDLPRWQVTGRPEERLMKTTHATLSENCEEGDGVYWFQSNSGFPQLTFSMIKDLLLENVHIYGGHGFPLRNEFCHNITYRNSY